MSQAPNDRKYSAEHQWALPEADGTITVGITDFAQETLDDLVFIQLPEVGSEVAANQQVATVESVKTASDVFAPMSGTVIAINEAAVDAPEKINEDAYAAWLFKIQPSNPAEYDALMSAESYLAAN
ncbi:glycine cleavage system protein GcvH [Fluviibacter phosphoraccumulans]|uniref:Glycine cleavage system H protein n=1 Tax=Fluviibacter phosphoraccumulans TaxID=1751046 RepID=A0A679I7Z2_9RHOO|nr:glycine cleavage system protein GcvH [Fluviibacter phosphoraccumulans]BBU68886.1 glycine cleavage system H protein 2 [Fluviibacter phosphoraccumulans]BBU71963.1 glycine cleavage system H protein 2 [Fluviibacter phosphoraccumulans]BCA64792.1 glycine cleavage system H protein 2 [Fluviibacter phosphoraccumulans]